MDVSIVGVDMKPADKKLFWPSNIKDRKKQEILNNLYIQDIFNKIKDKESISLYVQANKAITLREQMAAMYKQWCEDYKNGRTDDLPTITAIAKHFKVTPQTALIAIGPYNTKIFSYNYITAEELKEIGLYEREDFQEEDQTEI